MLGKKLTLTSLALFSIGHLASAQDLVISEVIDGALFGGLPKAVELTNNTASSIDLSGFSIGNFNNGGTTLGGGQSTVLSGFLPAGESYVISYESGDGPGVGVFFDVYGCDPDNFDLAEFINGNDVIALYLADGSGSLGAATGDGTDATLHDIYGEIGVDGISTAWEYTDSYAHRQTTTASSTFNAADWVFGGPDALESNCNGDQVCLTMNHVVLTNPTPIGGCSGSPTLFTDVCNGDGGNQMGCTNCPCMNEAMPGTVGGCLNSTGVGCRILGSGSGSVAAGDLRIEATGAVGFALSVLLSGNGVAPANMANPCFGEDSGIQFFQYDGLRCAVQSTQRHGSRVVAPDGTIGMTSNGWGPPNGPLNGQGGIPAQGGFGAGQTRYFQAIYRDFPDQVCMRALNTSQALRVLFTL